MPLKLTTYRIALARDGLALDKALEAGEGDGYDVHAVTVLHADQLVAEQAAPRYGVPAIDAENAQKMTWATLWVWCGLRRMGVTVPEFPRFKAQILELRPDRDTDTPDPDTAGEGEGDPTQPAGDTLSALPSPDTGPVLIGSPPMTG